MNREERIVIQHVWDVLHTPGMTLYIANEGETTTISSGKHEAVAHRIQEKLALPNEPEPTPERKHRNGISGPVPPEDSF